MSLMRTETIADKNRNNDQIKLCFSLALLVSNSAGSLAGRLARSLAVAAAALSAGLLEVSLVDRLYMFHKRSLPVIY